MQHHDCPCAEAPEAPEVPAKRKRTSCASVSGWSASHGQDGKFLKKMKMATILTD